MRRALGAQLAAFRQAADLTQGQVARAVFMDRTTVTHIEKGRVESTERFWTLADQRCNARGALLAGFRALEAARQDHQVRTREAHLAEARAKADALRAKITPVRFRHRERAVARRGRVAGWGPPAGNSRPAPAADLPRPC
jgi:DNA-binding XRE family transcriptional regulator